METYNKEELKALIEKEIIKTLKKVADYEVLSEPISPENSIGRVSRMDAINNRGVAEAALRMAQDKLAGLQHMLSRIYEADFGKCARCRNIIPFRRMLLMPQSDSCVQCAAR